MRVPPDHPELLELIKQIREGVNEEALAGIEVLREKEWLFDGSLYGAYLGSADLREADLMDANLSGVKLTEADLGEALLLFANLQEANLSMAGLSRADLYGASLAFANLSGVDLFGTDMRQASLYNTTLANIDLSTAKGLSEIIHDGPSYIDYATLELSQGKIPDVFLRGCGLSDTYIAYLPFLFNDPTQFYSAFISYNQTDEEFARRLHDRLQGAGIRCWLDKKKMRPGDPIERSIYDGIRTYDKILLCCSENSLQSWWVENEIEKTLEVERQLYKDTGEKLLKIIPLDLDGHIWEKDYEYASHIKRRLAADFSDWKDHDKFEAAVEDVIQALRTERPPDPKPKLGKSTSN